MHSLKAIMMKKNWKERWLGSIGAGWVKQDLVSSCRLWEKKMGSPGSESSYLSGGTPS